MHATLPLLGPSDFPRISRKKLQTLQVNLGYRCNQQCVHCHINAGPGRTEEMSLETVNEVIAYLETSKALCLDITGGAPELHPHFRWLFRRARELDARVIDRCNLTVLEEPGQEDLAEFLAEKRVEITASLPCYLSENVDRQRGRGVFDKSIRALRKLNALGCGEPASGLVLNLVYNPQGPTLPPPQAGLEAAYREHLGGQYGIVFDHLLTLANMPIQRFGSLLISKGQFHGYMRLLKDAHQMDNLESVMCRALLSVDWEGFVYDCDFNQMLGLPLRVNGRRRVHLTELMGADLEGNAIVVRDHCYGCTAGQGSSCGGALRA
jgi:radical SAM/Cys-rich protein